MSETERRVETRPIRRIRGRGVTIAGDDIDTDQIMPSRFLRRITFAGLEAHIFEDARRSTADGRPHPLDDPAFAGARILLVERNFGCGSSREHAPQGLRRSGIEAILGESFGEIFAGNCLSLGLVCVGLERELRRRLTRLCREDPQRELVLDLEAETVAVAGEVHAITLPPGRRRRLLEGTWDPLSQLLAGAEAVAEMHRKAPLVRRDRPAGPASPKPAAAEALSPILPDSARLSKG